MKQGTLLKGMRDSTKNERNSAEDASIPSDPLWHEVKADMAPLVSILIPAYNMQKWIRHTIQSALDQTWQNKEIIIVDDGSTDQTFSIANQFQSRQLKVIHQPNKGASAARNRALREAQGDLIQWLDADDILDPGKVSEQIRSSGIHAESLFPISSTCWTFYYRRWKAKRLSNALCRDLSPLEWVTRKISDGIWILPAAWLVPRALTERAGPWDERLSLDDDGEYFCRIVRCSETIRFNDQAKIYYRVGNFGSLSQQNSKKAMASLFLASELSINTLLSMHDSEETRAAARNMLERRLTYYIPEHVEYITKTEEFAGQLGFSSLKPQERKRFFYMRKLLGWKAAKAYKHYVWVTEESIKKGMDYFFFRLQEKGAGENS